MRRFILFICLIIVISCDDSTKKATSPNKDTSELIEKIESFNSSYVAEVPETKGIGSLCAIVGADFLSGYEGAKAGAHVGFRVGMICGGKGVEGALVGGSVMGLVCGVGGSYATYKGVCTKTAIRRINTPELVKAADAGLQDLPLDRKLLNENVNGCEKLKLPQKAVDVGILHNVLLKQLVKDDSLHINYDFGYKTSQLDSIIIYSDEFISVADSSIRKYEQSGVELDSASLSGKVMQLYKEIFDECADSYEDIVECINAYYDIISKSSELDDDEKNSIYAGLAVSLYSLNYWKENGTFFRYD